MKSTYENTAALGAAGKKLVMEFFQEEGCLVADLTRIEDYANKSIDFMLTDESQTSTVCVRTDAKTWETGNIVLETLMCRGNTQKLVRGWFFTCQAEILAYLDAYSGNLYFIDWELLKEAANHNDIGYRWNFTNRIDNNTIGQVHIIPIHDLKSSPSLKAIFKLDTSSLQNYIWNKPLPF